MNDRDLLDPTDAAAQAPGWRLDETTLRLDVDAGGFPAAIDLVTAIADIAESQQHHPDIDIRYDRVQLAVASHDVGGLTARDVRFANAVTALVDERGLRPADRAPAEAASADEASTDEASTDDPS